MEKSKDKKLKIPAMLIPFFFTAFNREPACAKHHGKQNYYGEYLSLHSDKGKRLNSCIISHDSNALE